MQKGIEVRSGLVLAVVLVKDRPAGAALADHTNLPQTNMAPEDAVT